MQINNQPHTLESIQFAHLEKIIFMNIYKHDNRKQYNALVWNTWELEINHLKNKILFMRFQLQSYMQQK